MIYILALFIIIVNVIVIHDKKLNMNLESILGLRQNTYNYFVF